MSSIVNDARRNCQTDDCPHRSSPVVSRTFCDGSVQTAYVTHEPCLTCARALVRRGVRRVVFRHPYASIAEQERAERAAILGHCGVSWEHLA